MAATSDGYSRLVAWMKIILPLIALAMLSTLFLVSRGIDPGKTIPYADVDVERLAREARIGAPSYAGMTEDGAAVSFRAESALPGSDTFTAQRPEARIELPTGRTILIEAKRGHVDREAGIAALAGEAVVETSDGYRIETDEAEARLDMTLVETLGPVRGEGPVGEFDAGRMVLNHSEAEGYVLRFEGGVNLVYRPAG